MQLKIEGQHPKYWDKKRVTWLDVVKSYIPIRPLYGYDLENKPIQEVGEITPSIHLVEVSSTGKPRFRVTFWVDDKNGRPIEKRCFDFEAHPAELPLIPEGAEPPLTEINLPDKE